MGKGYADCGLKGLTDWSNPETLLQARQCFLKAMDLPNAIKHLRERYPVKVDTTLIDGIEVDDIVPTGGYQ